MGEFHPADKVLFHIYTLGFVAKAEAGALLDVAEDFQAYFEYEQLGYDLDGKAILPYATSLGLVRAVGEIASTLHNQHQRAWQTLSRTSRDIRKSQHQGDTEQQVREGLHFHVQPVMDVDGAGVAFEAGRMLDLLHQITTNNSAKLAAAALDDQALGRIAGELGATLANDAHYFIEIARTKQPEDATTRLCQDNYFPPLLGAALRLSRTIQMVVEHLTQLRSIIIRLRVLAGQPNDADDEDWLAEQQAYEWVSLAATSPSFENVKLAD